MSHYPFKKGKKFLKKLSKRLAPELRELLILWFISKKPSHGYEIIKRFDELDASELKTKANRIYPGLEELKKKGFLNAFLDTARSQRNPRKVYSLTPEGKEHLLKEIEELRGTLDSLHEYLDSIDKEVRKGPKKIRGRLGD